MPNWNAKQERQYKHIKQSCKHGSGHKRGRAEKTCRRIAAATVNARRLGVITGRCCVLRGHKRVACFTRKTDAEAFKRGIRKTRGLKIACS